MKNLMQLLDEDKLHIIPCGGCGEFGMNMTAYIRNRKLFLVDAGILFPDPRKLGVASVIPYIDHLIVPFTRVEAYIITHGHEDHIGGLPFLYRRWPAPVYATPWTCELIKKKFKEKNLPLTDIHLVRAGQTVKAPPLSVTFIHVNHSIPDACALHICSDQDTVFHTGDFKIDPRPVGTHPVDLKEWEKIGSSGIDLLIADSTNAGSPGPSPAESSVIKPLEKLIKKAKGRVILTTFSSNLWRLIVIADLCHRLGKKLLVAGRGLQTSFEIGNDLGYFQWPEGILISEHQLNDFPDSDIVILASGSQGEFRSALSRIALKEHKFICIRPGDTIIFSARIIPGNEKAVFSLSDLLKKQGAEILTTRQHPGIHVSGHAYEDDIKKVLKALKPRHFLPVHGTFSHLQTNAGIGEKLRYTENQRTVIENGDILQLHNKISRVVGKTDPGLQFIDQDSGLPMHWETLRERLRIGELGVAFVTGLYSKKKNSFLSGPEITIQGLATPPGEDSGSWLCNTESALETRLCDWVADEGLDENTLNSQCRIFLRRMLYAAYNKKPVVMAKLIIT